MAMNPELASLYAAAGDGSQKKKRDLFSETSDSSDSESSSNSSSSSDPEGMNGERTFKEQESKQKGKKPAPKNPAKSSTTLTEYDKTLMYKSDDPEFIIKIFRTTKEKAKIAVPSDKEDADHIDFFFVKDFYEVFDNLNPRIGKEFAELKRQFKCKETKQKGMALPVWVVDGVLGTIKKSAPKQKKLIKELFKTEPLPYSPGTKRKLADAASPKAKKPKLTNSKTGAQLDQDFDTLNGMVSYAFKMMPTSDKKDVCNALRTAMKKML